MFRFINFLFLLVLLNGCGAKPGVTNPDAPAPVIPADKACSEFLKADCPAPRCEFYNGVCEEKATALKAKKKILKQEKARKKQELETLDRKPEDQKTNEEKQKTEDLKKIKWK